MDIEFSNCIAIGVFDKKAAAERFVKSLGCQITNAKNDWIELTAGPLKLYLVEDGTKDIAFAVNVPAAEHASAVQSLFADGFVLDKEVSERTGETFVRDSNGILINVYPAK